MSEESRREECEEFIDSLRGTMSDGQLALEALLHYRASAVPAPEWALREIEACYHDFKFNMRPAGWTHLERKSPAPRSLGEAFGIEPKKGMHVHAARTRALMGPQVAALFNGPYALPDSAKGYEEAAERLGLTEDQVREMLRTR